LVGLVPSSLLVLQALLLLWSGALRGIPSVTSFADRARQVGLVEGVLIGYAVLLCSVVLLPFALMLVRVLEGYWPTWLGRLLARPCRAWHRRRRARLYKESFEPRCATPEQKERAAGATTRFQLEYPADDRVMPTRLGNALRAAEDQAGQLYGLETVDVWPRLHILLPEKMEAILADERNQLDLAARLCLIFLISGLVFAVALSWPLFNAVGMPHRLRWLSVPLADLVLAWLSYRGAVNAAIAYGVDMGTAFDLYRFDLLRAMHLRLPDNPTAERRISGRVSELCQRNIPERRLRSIVYEHPADAGAGQDPSGSSGPGSAGAA
jgi:hypothetical protein